MVIHAELNSINEIITLNTWDTTVQTYMFGIFNGPRQIWGLRYPDVRSMTRVHISLPLQYSGHYCISQEEQEQISTSMWTSNKSKE